jgi:predicted ATPase
MTPGLSQLSINGYRRLASVNIPLRPLNVLIGANGVGKSSFLDVFGLLAASAGGTLQSSVGDLGGMKSLVTADGQCNGLKFALRMEQQSGNTLDYQLWLSSAAAGYVIEHELLVPSWSGTGTAPNKYIDAVGSKALYYDGGRYLAPSWDYKTHETALSQVPRTYREAESFRQLLSDVSEVYHALDVSRRGPVRAPQVLSPAQTPGADGENLVSCLYNMRETERDRFTAVEDALRAAFPAFEQLGFPLVGGGRGALTWQESGAAREFYASELSEGTLRFLWLATLLQSPDLPRIALIDEPEVSLHPEMLRLLTDLMREAAQRCQLVVATHSDRLVRFLDPSELLVCDKDANGSMIAQWADTLDLEEWMQDYTLDELWSMGRLGGRS